ncbi:MAG TPA: glucose-6-phosphate isomerase [Candidatus Aminicenantes bacterium]|nr:glucose-6-phosphate isomerase [Candidatus Aminicenantes bacterium]
MDFDARDIRIVRGEALAPGLEAALGRLDAEAVVGRVWDRDGTVWKPDGREASDRLGWLDCPAAAAGLLPELQAFAASLRDLKLKRAVVLGMGGSSLAPEVYSRLFGLQPGALDLDVLDTTEPETVARAAARLTPDKTLFLVSSKSGTTAEVAALLAFFYDRVGRALGPGEAGGRFVAVTDPGTPLEALARELGFRRTFLGRPDIGGRFSALSVFGLLPAALAGVDLVRLLGPALTTAEACRSERAAGNPGALLGAVLGTAALGGLDKLTVLLPPRLRPFAAWLEQLVAESTGKDGRGIVPVVEDRPGPAESYGPDRLFVAIGPGGRTASRPAERAPEASAAPLVKLAFDDPYEVAGHFFLWEFATAVAGHILNIDPFDQPDVESAKRKTREVLAAGPGAPSDATSSRLAAGDVRLAGTSESPAVAGPLFLRAARDGDYLALLAFLPRRRSLEDLLSGLAAGLRLKTGLPVTVGFGPRYLHSTGQLHKGGGNKGLFLVLVPAALDGLAIPEVPGVPRPADDFATLFLAQARGDALALAEKGRRVLTVELAAPLEAALGKLASILT